MKKYFNEEGLVGVVYSPGYGAGWSSWSDSEAFETMTMDYDVVKAVLEGCEVKKVIDIVKSKVGDKYIMDCRKLSVDWISPRIPFMIEEYDGNEYVKLKREDDWYIT